MRYQDFLDARLIFLVGAPNSGQELIIEQLIAVGLVGPDEVVFLGSSVGDTEPGRELNELEIVASSRSAVFRRTVVALRLTTVEQYDRFVEVAQKYDTVACIVVMDMHSDAVLARLRDTLTDPVDLVRVEELLDELASGDPWSLGLPSVGASALSRAIEGQDDW